MAHVSEGEKAERKKNKRLLEKALTSSEKYPINLEWMVGIFGYKHISSLITHLKRHARKDIDYKKRSPLANARVYDYFITIDCFNTICGKARHESRKKVAQYWLAKCKTSAKERALNSNGKREFEEDEYDYKDESDDDEDGVGKRHAVKRRKQSGEYNGNKDGAESKHNHGSMSSLDNSHRGSASPLTRHELDEWHFINKYKDSYDLEESEEDKKLFEPITDGFIDTSFPSSLFGMRRRGSASMSKGSLISETSLFFTFSDSSLSSSQESTNSDDSSQEKSGNEFTDGELSPEVCYMTETLPRTTFEMELHRFLN